MDVEANAGVGLESFSLLKLLAVTVVLRRFLWWFWAKGWRFLMIYRYCQHKLIDGPVFISCQRMKNSRDATIFDSMKLLLNHKK